MLPMAKPILKWAGGKQALASELAKVVPKSFGTYFEPFFGGGSVFLAVGPRCAVICDDNDWLMNTYRAVKSN